MDLAATRLRMPAVVKALRFHSLENSASRSLFEASQQSKSFLSLFLWLFRISYWRQTFESWGNVLSPVPRDISVSALRAFWHSDTFQIWQIDWFDSDKFELKNTTLDFSEQRSLDNGLLWKSWWTIRPPVRQIWTPTLTDSSPVSASNESNVWLNDVESVPKGRSS